MRNIIHTNIKKLSRKRKANKIHKKSQTLMFGFFCFMHEFHNMHLASHICMTRYSHYKIHSDRYFMQIRFYMHHIYRTIPYGDDLHQTQLLFQQAIQLHPMRDNGNPQSSHNPHT